MKVPFNNFHLMVIKQGLICTLNVLKEHASDIPPTSLVFISPYGLSPKVKISHIVTPKLHTSLLVVKRCLSKLSRAYLGIGAKHKNHIFCKIAEILRALSLVDMCVYDESMKTRSRLGEFSKVMQTHDAVEGLHYYLEWTFFGDTAATVNSIVSNS